MGNNSEIKLPAHLINLPGSDWALWRCVALRGAGFPASQVLTLSSQERAEASDSLINARAQAAIPRLYIRSFQDQRLVPQGLLHQGSSQPGLIRAGARGACRNHRL